MPDVWGAENWVYPPSSGYPGKRNPYLTPYGVPFGRAIARRRHKRCVFMVSAQSGKSETILDVIGQRLDQQPAPILYVGPEPPCPGMIWQGWPGVLTGRLAFLNERGVEAVSLGFGTRELFGVHRLAAALRVDPRGAIVMVTWVPIATMEPGVIRLVTDSSAGG